MHWVAIDQASRPRDAKPSDPGRMTPFGNEDEAIVRSLAQRWAEFLRVPLEDACAPAATTGPDAQGLLEQVRAAITEYHLALDRRQHGGIAGDQAFAKICNIMNMPWVQNAALNALAAESAPS